jgi:hypothetical protein
MDPQELVPVAAYRDTAQADIVRNALEAEGIRATVEGPHQGGLPGALEARVFVQAADAERARAFIQEHEPGG